MLTDKRIQWLGLLALRAKTAPISYIQVKDIVLLDKSIKYYIDSKIFELTYLWILLNDIYIALLTILIDVIELLHYIII